MSDPNRAAWQPAPSMTISDTGTLRVVSDPFRLRILDHLVRPLTVKELAAELGILPTKLYYHIRLLERHGLIHVTETRFVSGIEEKRYQATALALRVDHALLATGSGTEKTPPGLALFLTTVLDTARAEMEQGVREGRIDLTARAPDPRAIFLLRGLGRLAPAELSRFYTRLQALLEELGATRTEPAQAGAQWYGLAVALYPAPGAPEEPSPRRRGMTA